MAEAPKVQVDQEVLAPYLVDESGFRGDAEGLVRTGDPLEIAALMRAASARGTPVTFSARRTSLTGAAIPAGGLVIALPEDSSPDLVRVDRVAAQATSPARVLVSDVEGAAEAAGFFFAPDPTSRKTSSIGGAVACNASGARSFGFGPTGAWVDGLVVVLASGDVLDLKRGQHPPVDGFFEVGGLRIPCPPPRRVDLKNSLGYSVDPQHPDLIDLFVGSEGTLGYIHEVTMRLLPRQEIFAALVFWHDLTPALDFVERLQGGVPGLTPMSVEWFDQASLALASARHPRLGVPADAVAALFVEQRHEKGAEDAVAAAWYEALLEAGAPDDDTALRIARNRKDIELFRDFRHAVPESINALARSRGLRKLGTDLAYPRGWLHRMVAHYTEAVAQSGLDAAAFGHIGDNHLHLNLLPKDVAEAETGKALYQALALHCASVGGAISGEHGVGKSKAAMLARTTAPEVLAAMRAVKDVLDPAGILGRGNIFG